MSEELHLVDAFWTFQGEGAHAGRRALFVRMPFCNLKCTWCDTKFDEFKKWSESDFLAFAQKEPGRFAVLTGGEPTLHKHSGRVISLLKGLGYEIAIETNGTAPVPQGIDFVTCSPKRFAKPEYFVHPYVLPKVSEFKYVVDREFDFAVLQCHQPAANPGVRYSLSPEFNNLHENLARIFDFIKENPQWRISLQTHKWMQVP